jgi:hypothetical protein
MFRDRMKEIRNSEKGASESGAEEEAVAVDEPSAPAPKKKKGCMGMLLLGIGLVSAGIAGSLSWLL